LDGVFGQVLRFFNEVGNKYWNVVDTLAQRRYGHGKYFQALVKVRAESRFFHQLFQILVGRGDDSDIDFDDIGAADSLNLALLKNSKQFYLSARRRLPDLVEKQRASVGELKNTFFEPDRASKGTLFMAKKLAFEQGQRQRSTVDGDGRIVRERFVARAAFSSSSVSAINKPLAKQGVTLRLSNADGPYAECHLPLKNFDVDMKDWKWVTSAAFSVSFDAGIKKNEWVMKKTKKDEFCVVNLGQPDVHRGIPEIQEGDLVDVLEGSARVLEGEVRLEDDSRL
jgi:hypothetical protein